MSEVLTHVDDDATVIFHAGSGMMFNTESPRVKGSFGPTPSTKKDPTQGRNGVALWGDNNDRPQLVVAAINESDLLRPLIRKQAKRMVGQGLVYGTTTVDQITGEERMKCMRVKEIDQVLKRTNVMLFLYEQWVDWLTHGNAFPELQTDYDGKVVGLYSQDACRCRLSLKDEKGRINTCYIGGAWDQGGGPDGDGTFGLPALDPYYDPAGQIARSKQSRFILPIRLLVDDNDYYGDATWKGLIEGGYLDLAKAIIKCKLYLTQNLSLIRYHIEIGKEYWDLAFPGFKDKDPKEKKKIKDDVVAAFTKWATGQEKAGRTLMTEMMLDEISAGAVPGKREYRSLWKITPLKLDIPTGAYVEDSAEVDAKIIRAFMDASLFGATPSKDRNSAGSGSDKRIAHTHELIDNWVDAQLLLTPLDIMAESQGWHDKYGGGQLIQFWFKNYHAATLDRTLGAVSQKAEDQKNKKDGSVQDS